MVRLDKIYTRAGDTGETRLSTGELVPKWHPRVAAYGTVDELNAALGVAALAADGEMLAAIRRIQNDLFDLGADLATPDRGRVLEWTPLRIIDSQVTRLETEIDAMNAVIPPLRSFVLPGGSPGAAHAHLARTVVRRAERLVVALAGEEPVNPAVVRYLNRLSDHLFVLSRRLNDNGAADVTWTPGATR